MCNLSGDPDLRLKDRGSSMQSNWPFAFFFSPDFFFLTNFFSLLIACIRSIKVVLTHQRLEHCYYSLSDNLFPKCEYEGHYNSVYALIGRVLRVDNDPRFLVSMDGEIGCPQQMEMFRCQYPVSWCVNRMITFTYWMGFCVRIIISTIMSKL